MADDSPSTPRTPRIEVRDGKFYLVVRGPHDGEEEPWRVYLVVWDPGRRRHVPARRHAATHVVFVPRRGARRSALVEWPDRLARDYGFLRDPAALATMLRRAAYLPTSLFDPADINSGRR